ncbi:MAG: hypothetical protein HZA79_06305 [Sphingobacteriales bacterium]|nr:hypothetical protein [Sphingobacteriales bacterium]
MATITRFEDPETGKLTRPFLIARLLLLIRKSRRREIDTRTWDSLFQTCQGNEEIAKKG